MKQFAKAAALATNHWFAGDVSGLYRTIGEKTPLEPTRCALMPKDKAAFVRRVLEGLPSPQFEVYEGRISNEATQDYYRRELAELAIKYVQLEEALGEPPEMKQLGEKFSYRSGVLNSDEGEAWNIFSQAVQKAKAAINEGLRTRAPVGTSAASPNEKASDQVEGKSSWLQRILGRN